MMPRSRHPTTPRSPKPPPAKRQRPVIAIDGPAGAGKSTLAAHLARRFGFLNLETGAMYRALALKAIENDYAFDEEAPLLDLATHTRIALEPQPEGNRVLLDGHRRLPPHPRGRRHLSRLADLRPPPPSRLDGPAAARTWRRPAASSWKAATSAPPSSPTPKSKSSSTRPPKSAAIAAIARPSPNRSPAANDPNNSDRQAPDPVTAEQQRLARGGHPPRAERARLPRPSPRRIAAPARPRRRHPRLHRYDPGRGPGPGRRDRSVPSASVKSRDI